MAAAALYASFDGVNEKRLRASVNMIQDWAEHRKTITTTTDIRLMLDQVATVEETLGLLLSGRR